MCDLELFSKIRSHIAGEFGRELLWRVTKFLVRKSLANTVEFGTYADQPESIRILACQITHVSPTFLLCNVFAVSSKIHIY